MKDGEDSGVLMLQPLPLVEQLHRLGIVQARLGFEDQGFVNTNIVTRPSRRSEERSSGVDSDKKK